MTSSNESIVDQLTYVSRWFRSGIAQAYLTQLQLSDSAVALLKLIADDRTANWTQSQLAAEVCLSESSLCALVERLRCDRLLDRQRIVTDRRKTRLVLTELGERRLNGIYDVDREIEHFLQQELLAEEQQRLITSLMKLQGVLRGTPIQELAARRAA